jgi:hypothetical protein
MKSRSLTSILSDDDNETNNNRSMSDRKWQLNGRLNNCRAIVDGSLKLLNHQQPAISSSYTIDEDCWLPAAPSIPTTTNSIMHYANRQAKNHRHNKTNNYILWILTPVAAR